MLLRLVRKRFGNAVDREPEDGVTEASAEELEPWSDRVVSAAPLVAPFAD